MNIKPLNVVAAFMFATSAALPLSANADAVTNITITSVVQRWPWNNKVDITYTVNGGQDRSAGVYCGLRFAVTANGQTYNFEGYTIGASAENGTHTATWTAPEGVVSDACTLTATLFTTNVPSGNDYMIVDLSSGDVCYEGLYISQDKSNERYNTTDYKTDKLVLRRIPRVADSATLPNGPFLSGYPTGYTDEFANDGPNSTNSRTNWVTRRDYYIGVFPVTQQQYINIYGSNPSQKSSNVQECPVDSVSWLDLRSPYYDNTTDFAATSSIPAVASNTGTFFQRLNYKTGLYFDLPTEVMYEIAQRAGVTTRFWWGETMHDGAGVDACAVYDGNSSHTTAAVGSKLPNSWGIYDIAGNVWEWCLDEWVDIDMVVRKDAFTPVISPETGAKRRRRGSGRWDTTTSTVYLRVSYRSSTDSNSPYYNGFRVALIAE